MHTLRRLRYDVRTYLGPYPNLCLPLLAFRRRKRTVRHWLQPQVFDSGTEMVVEGFPRSGNTFSIAALYVATDHKLPKLAHHIHVPAPIIQAVREGKPAIALIRKPVDAMASALVHDPRLGPLQVLRAYIQFYQPLLPYRNEFVTATFETVTGNFGAVIDDVNERYGTSIPRFTHNEETVKVCFDLIEERNSMFTGTITEHKIARPSDERKKLNEDAKSLLRSGRYSKLLARTEQLYSAFL